MLNYLKESKNYRFKSCLCWNSWLRRSEKQNEFQARWLPSAVSEEGPGLHSCVTHIGTQRSSEMHWKQSEFFLRVWNALHLQGRADVQLHFWDIALWVAWSPVLLQPICNPLLQLTRLLLQQVISLFCICWAGKGIKSSSNNSRAQCPWSQEIYVTSSPV